MPENAPPANQEWTLYALPSGVRRMSGPAIEPGERVLVARPEDVRAEVVKEIAEGLRERALRLRAGRPHAANVYADGWDEAADWIERTYGDER